MESVVTYQIPENKIPDENREQDKPVDEEENTETAVASEEKYNHVRSPELRLGGTRIAMGIAAACGLAAGALAVITGKTGGGIFEELTKHREFGEVFLRRGTIGLIALAAEFSLGYFAAGDWLVWLVPLILGMGTGMWFAAAGSWILIPSAAGIMAAAVFGAASSSDFSVNLRRLTRGGVVFQDSSPTTGYAVRFAGYFAVVAASALYEGLTTLFAG